LTFLGGRRSFLGGCARAGSGRPQRPGSARGEADRARHGLGDLDVRDLADRYDHAPAALVHQAEYALFRGDRLGHRLLVLGRRLSALQHQLAGCDLYADLALHVTLLAERRPTAPAGPATPPLALRRAPARRSGRVTRLGPVLAV